MEGAGEGEVCRTCLGARALAPLFPDPATSRSVQLALRLCTGLEMKDYDGLPQFICKYCNENIQSFMLFRIQSRIVNQRLQYYYHGRHPAGSTSHETDALSIKSESLPTSFEIATEAKIKLSQFYTADSRKNISSKFEELKYSSTVKEEFGDETFMQPLEGARASGIDEYDASDVDMLEDPSEGETQKREKSESMASFHEYWEIDFLEKKFEPQHPDNTVEHKTSSIHENSIQSLENDQDILDIDCGITDLKKHVNVDHSSGTKSDAKDTSVEVERPLTRIKKPVAKRRKRRRPITIKKVQEIPEDKEEVYLNKLAKREEFRQKCFELIEGTVDRNSTSFKCKLCHNTYTRTGSFIRHAQRHIGYSNYYDCEHCNKRFSTLNSQVRHKQKNHSQQSTISKSKKTTPKPKEKDTNTIRNCDDPEEFRKKCSELMEEPYDKRNETIKCKLCRSVYKSITAFRKHAQVHLGYRYACEYCQKLYPSRSDLTQHIKKKHPKQFKENPSSIPPVQKPVVKPSEIRTKSLELVDGTYVGDGKRLRCNLCKAVCNNMHSFESHAQTHLGFKHLCEFCAKGFPSQAHLKQHLQGSHGFARELSCSYCDYKAVVRNQLKVHERRFHTQERPFVCETCGAAYFSKSVLAQHIQLRHEAKKRIKCDGCSRTFRLLRELTYHKKLVHQLACTYLCHVCGSTFTKTTSIRKHYLRIHKIPREEQVDKLQRLYNGQPATLYAS